MAAVADATFRELAGRLEGRLEAILEAYWERVREEMPEFFGMGECVVTDGMRVARESIQTELAHLRDGARMPEECPAADAYFAQRAAALGVSPAEVVRGYRRGQAVQWEAWHDLVESAELDDDVRAAVLREGTRFFFAYADLLSGWSFAAYTTAREQLLASAEQRRVNVVRDVLAGRDDGAARLGYDVAGFHVGIVGSGKAAPAEIRRLAARTGRELLLVQATESTWWGWLGGRTPLGGAPDARAEHPAASLAFGREAEGPDGFRATHEEALVAARAGAATFADVALEALAGRDRAAAAAFVRAELRGLDAEDERSAVLRETLAAYFATGHNAAAAAARLGVHEQTVAARLRAAEEHVGRPVVARRAELEVALRLRAWLAADP